MQQTITICCVNWFSGRYLNRLFENLFEKAAGGQNLTVVVIDNTAGKDVALAELISGYPVEIVENRTGDLRGSYGHAAGLNTALGRIATPYALVVDPDVYLFKNHWDTFLIELLTQWHAIAAGIAYPPWQLGKYHNFPSPVFCFFDVEAFLQLEPDWTPFADTKLTRITDFLLRNLLRCGIFVNRSLYERSPAVRKYLKRIETVVGVCSKDTGWRTARNAARKNLNSVLFNAAILQEKPLGPELKGLARHFELYLYEREPILAHKYGTMSKIWKTPKGSDESFWRFCIDQAEKIVASEPRKNETSSDSSLLHLASRRKTG